jgi:hypothetical protein
MEVHSQAQRAHVGFVARWMTRATIMPSARPMCKPRIDALDCRRGGLHPAALGKLK